MASGPRVPSFLGTTRELAYFQIEVELELGCCPILKRFRFFRYISTILLKKYKLGPTF
jgi:hypothetical protein